MGRVREEEIDILVYQKSEGLTDLQIEKFKEITDRTSWRQYVKKSKKALNKSINAVRKNIKKAYPPTGIDKRGFVLPEQKGKKGKGKKEGKKKSKMIEYKPKYKKTDKERKYTKETKSRVEKALAKYPNASNYELRHGVNSKASQEYRLRHGMERDYK